MFHLKSSFCSWDISILSFSVRKLGLISTFMTSEPGKQTIAIHISSNISRSKGNETIARNCLRVESPPLNYFSLRTKWNEIALKRPIQKFGVKINDRGALNFSFFVMNYFECKCMASEEGCVPKCTVAYSQIERVKNSGFLRTYLINDLQTRSSYLEVFC